MRVMGRIVMMVALAALISGCGIMGKEHIDTRPQGTVSGGHPVVRTALSQIGTSYKWGGQEPRTGFDCSGLAWWSFKQHGVSLPRPSWEQYKVGRNVNRSELRPGDLVFYNIDRSSSSLHVGIVVEPGRFVHSPKSGGHVRVDNMSNPYWTKHYLGARRVM